MFWFDISGQQFLINGPSSKASTQPTFAHTHTHISTNIYLNQSLSTNSWVPDRLIGNHTVQPFSCLPNGSFFLIVHSRDEISELLVAVFLWIIQTLLNSLAVLITVFQLICFLVLPKCQDATAHFMVYCLQSKDVRQPE